MSDKLKVTLLFDIYSPLLTNKQRDTLDLYCNEDLSLAEIAETAGTTRQAVMNCILKCEKRLAELEESFGLYEKSKRAGALLEKLGEHTDGSGEASVLIEELKALI